MRKTITTGIGIMMVAAFCAGARERPAHADPEACEDEDGNISYPDEGCEDALGTHSLAAGWHGRPRCSCLGQDQSSEFQSTGVGKDQSDAANACTSNANTTCRDSTTACAGGMGYNCCDVLPVWAVETEDGAIVGCKAYPYMKTYGN